MNKPAQGFALITAAIVLLVAASVALLLTSEVSVGQRLLATDAERAEQRYLIEAGFAHAEWQLAQNDTCVNFAALPATNFGAHSYNASFSPDYGSPTTVTLTAKHADGVIQVVSSEAVPAYQPPTQIVLQPSAADGSDAYIWQSNPTTKYGTDDETWVSCCGSNTSRSILQFDLSNLAVGAKIVRATLSMYHRSGYDPNVPVTAHRITNPWNEANVTWDNRDTGTPWDTAGGDFDATVIATTNVGPVSSKRYEWDVSDLVKAWYSGATPNYGLILATTKSGSNGERFDTSDHVDPTRRPSLIVELACECGITCAGAVTNNLLMVVVDPLSLLPQESLKKALFESWGYTIELIDEADSQANFDAAVAVNDVVFITEDVQSSTVSDKLAGATIGVVTEEANLSDEFGLSTGIGWESGTQVEVNDNTHFITKLFPLGLLTVFDVAESLAYATGTLAPDAGRLASSASGFGVLTLDSGAAMHAGGNAAGRRVMLPWGGNDMDVASLNADGLTIFERALEWAATTDPLVPRIWFATAQDVASSGVPDLDSWSDGQVLQFGDPGLALESGTTAGTFTSVTNLDAFAADSNAGLDAMHYVETAITVGSSNSVDLLPGDLLLSTEDAETLTSLNSISVADEDVFVFRPATPNDYSSGDFIFLLDGSQMHSEADTVGISLLEKGVNVGDGFLAQGTFVLATTNRRDVQAFPAVDVGLGTTSGTASEFIDGPTLSLGSEIRGMDVAEDAVTIGGHTIPAGSILLTLNNDDPGGVGDNLVAADSADIFYLTVSQVGSSPVADAVLLFEGADVNLDTTDEHLQALALVDGLGGGEVTGPIAHWKLDETGGPTALDSVGGHDGTWVSGPTAAVGVIGGALSFDGSNDHVTVPHDDNLSLTTFSISAWIRPSIFSGWRVFVNKGGSNTENNYYFSTFGDELSLGFYNGGWVEFNTLNVNLLANQWYHVAGTFDDALGEGKVYLDGALVHTGTTGQSPLPNSSTLTIGRSAAGEYWPGRLDDVRLYNTVLGAAEIADLASAGGGGGGGGPSCTATIADDFETDDYTGNTGSQSWNGNWFEVNENNDPNSGDEQVVTVSGNLVARVRDNDGGGEGILRSADLSGFTSAVLSFDYWRNGLDSASDYVAVEVWPDATSHFQEVHRIAGPGTDTGVAETVSVDISTFIMNDTHIRFVTSPTMGNNDIVYLDNLHLCLN